MTTYITDIIDYLKTQDAISFDTIDTTALDILVEDYLLTPENGYVSEEVTEVIYGSDSTANPYYDTTSTVTYTIDGTSPTITVLEWKEQYLETVYNQMFLESNAISIRDSNSVNYPLIDFKGALFDFDVTTSINYAITPDTTGDVYIEYEYPTAEKVDGMYLQTGIDGLQNYDALTNWSFLAFYVGYSDDGVTWKYIASYDGIDSTGTATSFLTLDQDLAIANPFWVDEETIDSDTLKFVQFPFTAIESKYWRLYMVDIEGGLIEIGEDTGYTGYTAAISHLRFQQYKEHGGVLATATVDRVKTKGNFAASISGGHNGTAGAAAWKSQFAIVTTINGMKQASIYFNARCYVDATSDCQFRVLYTTNYDVPSPTYYVADSWQILGEGDVVLIDSRNFINPNADVADNWQIAYLIQDNADVGTPATNYRYGHLTTFRSSGA